MKALAILSSWLCVSTLALAAGYTPLLPAPTPRITSNAVAYPGGSYNAGNLLDGKDTTE